MTGERALALGRLKMGDLIGVSFQRPISGQGDIPRLEKDLTQARTHLSTQEDPSSDHPWWPNFSSEYMKAVNNVAEREKALRHERLRREGCSIVTLRFRSHQVAFPVRAPSAFKLLRA